MREEGDILWRGNVTYDNLMRSLMLGVSVLLWISFLLLNLRRFFFVRGVAEFCLQNEVLKGLYGSYG
ncbi:MAG: hypothetical protein EBT06_07650 [Gammaproteobacteria bacterium]|nr:hypothetical protein [Gammaproteobacteria bacterium]NBY22329.1 hypothetical protein [Gammaproteobacteria bacterium]NDE56268.1 hypothetical protein [Gammaproteobacteria bacterium]